MTPRTPTGGSKNQSTASVTQNATPSQATAAASPSSQTYWRMRRRSSPSTASTAGASVGRSFEFSGHRIRQLSCRRSTPSPSHRLNGLGDWLSLLPFYASFTSRRISHSKHSRPHRAIIIQRSQVSSHWGFGAAVRITVVVRSFSCRTRRVRAVRSIAAAHARRNTCRPCRWRSRSAGRRCGGDSRAPGRAPSPGCGGVSRSSSLSGTGSSRR